VPIFDVTKRLNSWGNVIRVGLFRHPDVASELAEMRKPLVVAVIQFAESPKLAQVELRAIVLNNCLHVGDDEMDFFVGNQELVTLLLPGTAVTNAGIKKLEKMTQLQTLGAGSKGITEDVFDTITKLQKLRELILTSGVALLKPS
jgi:hypothetical protein